MNNNMFKITPSYWCTWSTQNRDAERLNEEVKKNNPAAFLGGRGAQLARATMNADDRKLCFEERRIAPRVCNRRGIPRLIKKAKCIRGMLDRHRYKNTESILNEWNYLRGWTNDFVYTIEAIHSIKGAAYFMSALSLAQPSSAI